MQGAQGAYDEPGGGWILFAGIMLMLVGVLNAIWGIAAIGDSSFFVNDQKYILSNLNTRPQAGLGPSLLRRLWAEHGSRRG